MPREQAESKEEEEGKLARVYCSMVQRQVVNRSIRKLGSYKTSTLQIERDVVTWD